MENREFFAVFIFPLSRLKSVAVIFVHIMTFIYASDSSASSPIKILFLGNSITKHAPSQDLNWKGNWGMASSKGQFDYTSVTREILSDKLQRQIEVQSINVSYFEKFPLMNVRKVAEIVQREPYDVLVFFLGDNLSSDSVSIDKFKIGYTELLNKVRADNQVIICIGVWWDSKIKDAALKSSCNGASGQFISLSDLSRNVNNRAHSERIFEIKGVGEHPGDRGMREIARRISERLLIRFQ